MATPTGTVSIYSYTPGGNLLATATLDSSGNYSVASSALTTAITAGIPVYAVYNGDGNFNGSTSAPVNDVITGGTTGTTTTLAIAPNPGTVGGSQTFSGGVTAA